MLNNYDRAMLGKKAVQVDPDYGQNDDATSLSDTLANIMHWAADEDIDFEQALDSARRHFDAEINGED